MLQKFELACSSIDGATNLMISEAWAALAQEPDITARSMMAINAQGEIACAGWFEIDERVDEVLAFLDGRVHPDFRGQGYGTLLLDWLESSAGSQMGAVSAGRPCINRIMFYDRAPDACALFESKGYVLQYIEQVMQRDLSQPWPDTNRQGLSFEPWTTENKPEFYNVYQAAFRTRTDELMPANAWHHHFANPNREDYQPSLSLLARQSGEPIAYAVIHDDEAPDGTGLKEAWITQTGVHQAYRRQGVGTALLTETMKYLHDAGYPGVKLSVNVNNPGAKSLYEHLGFVLVNSFTMYRKTNRITG